MIKPSSWLATLPRWADCLRPNQLDLIANIRDALNAGHRRILLQSDTGSGKTHVICAINGAAVAGGMRVLDLVTRTRLAVQMHDRLEGFGIPHGVIAAELHNLTWTAAPVQVAMVPTLHRRAQSMPMPSAELIVFDEAHLSLGDAARGVIERYPEATLIGVTATPSKISGRPLREGYDVLIKGPSTRSLIAEGVLVPCKVYSAPTVTAAELAAIRKDSKTGDYATAELGSLMSRPRLVGDVLQNWLRIANGKRTIIFACDKKHGAALKQEFCSAGVAAELLTDQDSEADREAAIYRLEQGRTMVLINCFLLSYGIDIPAVECVVLARPTRSIVLYRQAVGRGMRPSVGKKHLTVIDHGRVVEHLGLPDETIDWSLDDGANVNRTTAQRIATRMRTAECPRTCSECAHMWLVSEDGPSCDVCGWAPVPTPKAVMVEDAELEEIAKVDRAVAETNSQAQKFFAEALTYYATRWPNKWSERANSGRWWAWLNTKEKFKLTLAKPPNKFWQLTPVPITPATQGWIKSRLIAYARRQHA